MKRNRGFHERIAKLWNSVVNKMVERCALSTKKGQKIRADKYLNVTNVEKDVAIRRYLRSVKQKFIQGLRSSRPTSLFQNLPSERKVTIMIKSLTNK